MKLHGTRGQILKRILHVVHCFYLDQQDALTPFGSSSVVQKLNMTAVQPRKALLGSKSLVDLETVHHCIIRTLKSSPSCHIRHGNNLQAYHHLLCLSKDAQCLTVVLTSPSSCPCAGLRGSRRDSS